MNGQQGWPPSEQVHQTQQFYNKVWEGANSSSFNQINSINTNNTFTHTHANLLKNLNHNNNTSNNNHTTSLSNLAANLSNNNVPSYLATLYNAHRLAAQAQTQASHTQSQVAGLQNTPTQASQQNSHTSTQTPQINALNLLNLGKLNSTPAAATHQQLNDLLNGHSNPSATNNNSNLLNTPTLHNALSNLAQNSRSASTPPVNSTHHSLDNNHPSHHHTKNLQNLNNLQSNVSTTQKNSNLLDNNNNLITKSTTNSSTVLNNLGSQVNKNNQNHNQNHHNPSHNLHSSQNSTISFENNLESTMTRRSSHNDISEISRPHASTQASQVQTPTHITHASQAGHPSTQNRVNSPPQNIDFLDILAKGAQQNQNQHLNPNANVNTNPNPNNNPNNNPTTMQRFQFKKNPNSRIQNPASTAKYKAIDIHGNGILNDMYSEEHPSHEHLNLNLNPDEMGDFQNQFSMIANLTSAMDMQNGHGGVSGLHSANANHMPAHYNDSKVKTPWIHPETIYKPGSEGLAEEIVDFVNYIKTTPEEIYMRQKIIHKIKTVVNEVFPECKLKVFGSFKTGLYWVGLVFREKFFFFCMESTLFLIRKY